MVLRICNDNTSSFDQLLEKGHYDRIHTINLQNLAIERYKHIPNISQTYPKNNISQKNNAMLEM